MKKKNGFTLIELLGVIAILAVIAGIAIPAIQTTIKKNRQSTYIEQINILLSATDKYIVNTDLDEVHVYAVKPMDLVSEGYLKDNGDIKDPITGNDLEGCILIKWNEGTNQYSVKYYNLDDQHKTEESRAYTSQISSYYDTTNDSWNVGELTNSCQLSNS